MNRLAVYGWDDQEPRLLNALQHAGSFTLAAVGDASAAALVRARAATGSACYQHAIEMLRHAEYDAALLTTSRGAARPPARPRPAAQPCSSWVTRPTAPRSSRRWKPRCASACRSPRCGRGSSSPASRSS